MSQLSGLKHGSETSYPNWIFRRLPPSLPANAERGFISSLTFPSQQFAINYSQITLPPLLFTKSLNQTKTNETVPTEHYSFRCAGITQSCQYLTWIPIHVLAVSMLTVFVLSSGYVITKAYKKKLRTNFVYSKTSGEFF